MSKVLRVALVWQGTVLQERSVRSGSITVGGDRKASFNAPSSGEDSIDTLFSGSGSSFTLTPFAGMTGMVTIGGKQQAVAGGGSLNVSPGDWGVLNLGEVSFYFQWVEDDAAAIPFLSGAFDFNMASTITISAAVHLGLYILSALWPTPPRSQTFEIPDRLAARLLVDADLNAVEDMVEEDAPIDESTSKAAGGEEGRFGEEDAEVEDSVLPDHDGPLVEELQTTELGRAMDAAIGASGALTSVFGASDMMGNTFGADFATAGEGDIMIVGRGSMGLGMRGTGRGGGGDGLGRVHGVGDIDTGSGRGQGASLGGRGERERTARVSTGTPQVNGFLSREQIERVVRRHRRGLQYCYERELQNDPSLSGRVSVNWTIDLEGRVSAASVTENTIGNRNVESCVLEEVRRMRFDQPDGGQVVVTYPFTFSAGE